MPLVVKWRVFTAGRRKRSGRTSLFWFVAVLCRNRMPSSSLNRASPFVFKERVKPSDSWAVLMWSRVTVPGVNHLEMEANWS